MNFVWPVGGGKSLRGFDANLDLFLNLFKIIIVSQELAKKHMRREVLCIHNVCVFVYLCAAVSSVASLITIAAENQNCSVTT